MANEVRLIDAAPLIADGWVLEKHGVSNVIIGRKSLADVPTIDPESLRPKGRWVYDKSNLEWACSECLCAAHVSFGKISGYILSDFCPNCGAKMEG